MPCPACDPFHWLRASLTSLRGNANVEFAAMSLGGTPQASLAHAAWMSLLYVAVIAVVAGLLFIRRDVTS